MKQDRFKLCLAAIISGFVFASFFFYYHTNETSVRVADHRWRWQTEIQVYTAIEHTKTTTRPPPGAYDVRSWTEDQVLIIDKSTIIDTVTYWSYKHNEWVHARYAIAGGYGTKPNAPKIVLNAKPADAPLDASRKYERIGATKTQFFFLLVSQLDHHKYWNFEVPVNTWLQIKKNDPLTVNINHLNRITHLNGYANLK